MHTRGVTSLSRLIVACAIFLALPGSAAAAGMSVSGPASVGEAAEKATYTVTCGDTPSLFPPLPPVPNTGPLNVAITAGPAPAATQDEDHGAPTQTALACSAATPALTFDVPIVNDTADEAEERFTVTVSGALIAEGQVSQSVTTAIADDDPIASISPLVRVVEGDSAAGAAQLTVTLSAAAAQPTTVAYASQDGSAVNGSDYSATSGQLTIPTGASTGTVSVPIVADSVPEQPESFFVNLASTDNGSLDPAKKQATVTIEDTDKPRLPALSLPASVTTDEGARGRRRALFTISLSSASTERAQVAWRTSSGTASRADYASGKGTVVFQPGQRTRTISVAVKGDRRDEPDEAFAVLLDKPAGATIARRRAVGVIADDDGPKVSIGKPRARRRKALVVKVGCPKSASRCRGRLVATAGRLRFGRAKLDLAPGTSRKVKLKLSRKARAALRKRARRVKLRATAADASGDRRVSVRRARIKRRR